MAAWFPGVIGYRSSWKTPDCNARGPKFRLYILYIELPITFLDTFIQLLLNTDGTAPGGVRVYRELSKKEKKNLVSGSSLGKNVFVTTDRLYF